MQFNYIDLRVKYRAHNSSIVDMWTIETGSQ